MSGDRIYLIEWGRWCVTYELCLNFQWLPSGPWRFQRNGWHVYLWKFRLTRSSAKEVA